MSVIIAETRNAYRILVTKSLAKWQFRKLRRRLEDIEMGGGGGEGELVLMMKSVWGCFSFGVSGVEAPGSTIRGLGTNPDEEIGASRLITQHNTKVIYFLYISLNMHNIKKYFQRL